MHQGDIKLKSGGFLTRVEWKKITSPCASTLISQDKPLPDSFTYETKLKSPRAGHHSHGPCCFCLLGIFPGVQYFWGVGLARKVSPCKHVLFIQPVTCLVFCLMFLQKTGMCVCVCLVAILVCLSAFPPLTCSSSLALSRSLILILMCLCDFVHVFVWVFHP